MLGKFNDSSVFNLKSNPYTLLGIAGLIMAFISFFPIQDESLDINFHDTYFVIAYVWVYWFFAALLLFLWSVYAVADRLMFSRELSLVHVFTTLLPIIFFTTTNTHFWGISGVPRRYYAFTEFEDRSRYYNFILVYIAIIIVLLTGQLIFVFNVVLGIIKLLTQHKGDSLIFK